MFNIGKPKIHDVACFRLGYWSFICFVNSRNYANIWEIFSWNCGRQDKNYINLSVHYGNGGMCDRLLPVSILQDVFNIDVFFCLLRVFYRYVFSIEAIECLIYIARTTSYKKSLKIWW